ncbi:DEAD/DEAH box helicase [Pengzhenrongella sicca]|uniref:DEAD/DEAH box helicase family protein n=1 Tax=Pengzhenrongella sicca TaxID=2819238 RepID=A0A8A4ZDM8_9MICO|nr:DEAD/DEAH box helicase family protein [Pengzhenrongella sicca]QTE30062.1 DEAD/DEAH box helicase family protein [Pengzhenrongella sicca]
METYREALSFAESEPGTPGLRSPQLGAVHAVLGYWTTKATLPATVVMPTGTGKTETMLALLVAARIPRLLVLVPSDALREQIAAKFETLGILQKLGVVAPSAQRPTVGRIEHGFVDPDAARAFASACNVMVATPAALLKSTNDSLSALVGACTHLFVDEAHHVAANTWSTIRNSFSDRPVVQFTATPFREDGKHLQGRAIYTFPLREAQTQGYFSRINYKAVIDFDDIDARVAEEAVAQLRADLANGHDHVLMARVRSVERAKAVLPHYERIAADLAPAIINSTLSKRTQQAALANLASRACRIVVCVSMLGEGFDLPALKIAAVHDPQKSLGVTLQFIGRFARTSSDGVYGEASVFVARTEIEVDPRLRELYAEDSDWNLILRDVTAAAVGQQQEVSDFEAGFTSLPAEVTLRNLVPKLSTVVYRTPTSEWDPMHLVDFFGEANLYTDPIGINADAGVAWCVVERRSSVRWGELRTVEEIAYELYVLYFDRDRHLLYINHSANDGVFEDLATAVVGSGASRFTGTTVYRVMADIQRLVPTNVGVLDARDQFRRFSMHVGSDVTASFSQAEAGTKSQTNISGGGYRNGEHVTISASLKGRIWSHATAHSLKHWRDWCDTIGDKLLDDTISIDHVIGQFIFPEPLTARPDGVLLGVEWPWTIYLNNADNLRLSLHESVHPASRTDLVPDTTSSTGPFRFDVRSGSWSVAYEADIQDGTIRYTCLSGDEVTVATARSQQPLSQWLNANGLTFILDHDRIIDGAMLYRPTWDRPPFDTDQLTALDWTGINIRTESQTVARLPHSVQFRAITELTADPAGWDVILDDDGTGEIADLVCLRVEGDTLLIQLVHCKFSHGDNPGARVADLYELCGQAQKSVRWRRDLRPFFKALLLRAQAKHNRDGKSPFEVGDPSKLFELQEMSLVLRTSMRIVIVQPGMSISRASTPQLDLLASTQAYLRTTINAPLSVWCSP